MIRRQLVKLALKNTLSKKWRLEFRRKQPDGRPGRLPIAQKPGPTAGRDHGPSGFSVWMAGGGVKGGTVYGATDEIGYKAAENRVSVHDFHATILHLLGLNHRDLVYPREGRNERITDEFPTRVVQEILA